MKTITTTAIVALMAASIGLSAAAPAMAQQGMPNMQRHMHQQGEGPNRHFGNDGPRRPMMARTGMFGGLLSFGRTSERLEIALVRLSHRIELTDAQKPLLDSFKTAALAAQADYAEALAAARPARTAGAERPDIADRLGTRIAVEKAHLDALTAVQPTFEAFFASLTDAQKANLMPQRRPHMGWQQGKRVAPEELNGTATPEAAPTPQS